VGGFAVAFGAPGPKKKNPADDGRRILKAEAED